MMMNNDIIWLYNNISLLDGDCEDDNNDNDRGCYWGGGRRNGDSVGVGGGDIYN